MNRISPSDSPSDSDLLQLASRVAKHLTSIRGQLVTAESCTGGWIGKVLTDISGSSRWYLGGAVSYSNALKQSQLGVLPATLAAHGAVSEATARAMAVGALNVFAGTIALSVTGVAGPDGGQPDKPVGTVWFGWAWQVAGDVETRAARQLFAGDREAVRRQTVARALEEVLGLGG